MLSLASDVGCNDSVPGQEQGEKEGRLRELLDKATDIVSKELELMEKAGFDQKAGTTDDKKAFGGGATPCDTCATYPCQWILIKNAAVVSLRNTSDMCERSRRTEIYRVYKHYRVHVWGSGKPRRHPHGSVRVPICIVNKVRDFVKKH